MSENTKKLQKMALEHKLNEATKSDKKSAPKSTPKIAPSKPVAKKVSATVKKAAKAAPTKKVEDHSNDIVPNQAIQNQLVVLNHLADNLGLKITPDLLMMTDPKDISSELINRALEHGVSETEIEKAMQDIKF